MRESNKITGSLTIFSAFTFFFSNVHLISSFHIIGLLWIIISAIFSFYFIFAIKILRPLKPGKFIMSITWIGFFLQIFKVNLIIFTFGTSEGSMIVSIFSTSQIPFVSIVSGAICGRQNRSFGAFFGALSAILWILSFFLFLRYVLPITITLLGIFMLVKPIEVRWITKIRPSDKNIKISLVLGAILFFTIPYPVLGIINTHPQFITANWIELDKIHSISKFRSQAGHDYSDIYESGRSLKHYFQPYDKYGFTNNNISIFSPVDGILVDAWLESRSVPGQIDGWHLVIQPLFTSIYSIHLFHINLEPGIFIGRILKAGEKVGYAYLISDIAQGNSSNIDIAVECVIPIFGVRRISFFDVMNDDVFNLYKARGVSSRSDLIIPKETADLYVGWEQDYARDWFVLSPA